MEMENKFLERKYIERRRKKRHPIRRFFGGVLVLLLCLILAAGIALWYLFGPQLAASCFLSKLDDHLYAMEYAGDYGLDAFLDQGGASSDYELASFIARYLSRGLYSLEYGLQLPAFGCSAMTARNAQGQMLFGRNYDWIDCNTILVKTRPSNGYASISTSCLDFLGFHENWLPDQDLQSRFLALASVYVPLDGMNEKGLCVADLLVDGGEVVDQYSDKPDLTTTSALRLLLDRAATVEEAVSLLEQYDMHFSIGAAHHFAIADASGKCAAIEFIDGQMQVTETYVLTNQFESERLDLPSSTPNSHARNSTLASAWLNTYGQMEFEQVRDAMRSVLASQYGGIGCNGTPQKTQWTLVCSPQDQTIHFYHRENFDKNWVLHLDKGFDWIQTP